MYKNNFVGINVHVPIEVNFLPIAIMIITQNQGKNSGPAFSASLELTNPFHETELFIPENIRKSEVSRGI